MSKDTGVPFSPEAEEATLGACLIDNEAFLLVREYLSASDLFLIRHQNIWTAMDTCMERDGKFDMISLGNELEAAGQIEDMGGRAYLIKLVNSVSYSTNGDMYGRIVWRASVRRQLLTQAERIKALALDEERPLENVLANAERRIISVTEKGIVRSEKTIHQAVSDTVEAIAERAANPELHYLPFGIKALDLYCGGMERGNLLVIGGDTSMGKTSLALSIALSSPPPVRTAIISNEMTIERMTMRLLAMESSINLQALKRGALTPNEEGRYVEAIARLADKRILLDYIPETTTNQVHAKVIRWLREIGVDVLIIDGLWNMKVPEGRGDDLTFVYQDISQKLVDMAKEHNISVILIHQLKKNFRMRQDKRPTLDDLDFGKGLMRNVDIAMLIYRDEYYDPQTANPGVAEIIFGKNRDAPKGTVTLRFDARTTRFVDGEPMRVDLKVLSPKRQDVNR